MTADGAEHVVERVTDPARIAEIQRTAREGLLMPPESTFFTPKLRTGLVLRPTAALPPN